MAGGGQRRHVVLHRACPAAHGVRSAPGTSWSGEADDKVSASRAGGAAVWTPAVGLGGGSDRG
jgi:hypothetical protein